KQLPTDSYWLAVKSYPVSPKGGNSILNGTLLHFEKDSLKTDNIYSGFTEKFEVRTSKNQIYLNDSPIFKVHQVYSDSIILDYDFDTRVKFINLPSSQKPNESSSVHEGQWSLTYDSQKNQKYNKKLILTELPFHHSRGPQICIEKDISTNRFSGSIGKWSFRIVNGQHLFAKTTSIIDEEFYLVTEYLNNSSARVKCINCKNDVKATLTPVKRIEEFVKQNALKSIANKKWKIAKVREMDTISTLTRFPDSIPFQLSSIENMDLSFFFNEEDRFIIEDSNGTMVDGTWELSHSGEEIILNKGSNPSDYIDLINISPDSLEIGNLRLFHPDGNKFWEKVHIYYKVQLEH
ncbi:MAG: hypothetical protein AAGL29_13055, partial [Bacteroidota bacterium]